LTTCSSISAASGIASERDKTDRRVVRTGRIASECSRTNGRVEAAGRVANERKSTGGRIRIGGVVTERLETYRRVLDAAGVELERCSGRLIENSMYLALTKRDETICRSDVSLRIITVIPTKVQFSLCGWQRILQISAGFRPTLHFAQRYSW
jgi:hypothetical protein